MIPYSRLKLSDLYTPSQSKQLKNHTLHSGTGPYMAVSPPGGGEGGLLRFLFDFIFIRRRLRFA